LTPAIIATFSGIKHVEDAYTDPPAIPTLTKLIVSGVTLKISMGNSSKPLKWPRHHWHLSSGLKDVAVPPHNMDPSNDYNTVQE
jgi:hypothetical protein